MKDQDKLIPLSQMPLLPRDWYYLLVASMEQVIGTALSAVVGIMIPLILLIGQPHLSATEQGILGAAGLLGIAVGSVIIGQLMDSTGYLFWFRLCPLIITAGSLAVYFSDAVWSLGLGLFGIGLGVGGGYSLDSGYISEIMPEKWESFFVGLAKATCSLGFIGGAFISYIMLVSYPTPVIWPDLIWIVGILGIMAFLLRIHWYQSPRWLMTRGKYEEAQKAARQFMGPYAEVRKHRAQTEKPPSLAQMFEGENLKKVILSGVSWACEGLGVYGFGVFLPILVMALGLESGGETGIPKIISSVKTTTFINIFIGCGFALGLAILHKINILKLMGWSFIICAIALFGLWAGFIFKWAVWFSFICFVIFEVALNAGPHLVTYIIPAKIYSISERGSGMGIATLFGKIGAIMGVFFMPGLLSLGGITLVLWVSIVVQLIGAAVTFIYGRKLKFL